MSCWYVDNSPSRKLITIENDDDEDNDDNDDETNSVAAAHGIDAQQGYADHNEKKKETKYNIVPQSYLSTLIDSIMWTNTIHDTIGTMSFTSSMRSC